MIIESLGRLLGEDVGAMAVLVPLTLPVLLSLYVALRIRKRDTKNGLFPPGPKCIPFIGPVISRPDIPIYLEYMEWSKRFGSDIVGYKVRPGLQKVVILNSYSAIHDALMGQDSADALIGRQKNQISLMMNPNQLGVGEIDGPMWMTHRRFALRVMHDLGLGRPIIEDTIRARLTELLESIEKASTGGAAGGGERAPVEPLPFAMRAVGDVVGGLIFGERLSEDPHFDRVHEIFTKCFMLLFKQPEFVKSYAKYLSYLPGDRFKLKFAADGMQEGARYMMAKVQKRLEMEPSHDVRDYIDAYLLEKQKHEKAGDTDTYSGNQLARMAWEFFAAGMGTTSTVMNWSMLLLAHHQDVQEKARANVLAHLGADRQACYADRVSMKYLEAVINEVHRYGANSPLTMPRRAVRDCSIRGFHIPKDTLVFSNLWAAHHQPDIWPDPDHFNPDANFTRVGENGELELTHLENLMPFNIGKRACIGESLARQELLIFIAGLLQRYRILPSADCPLPAESEFEFHGIGRHPLPYKVLFVPLD